MGHWRNATGGTCCRLADVRLGSECGHRADPPRSSLKRWPEAGSKWLNTPFDCGYAFIADAEAHRGAFSHRMSYTMLVGDARDQIDWQISKLGQSRFQRLMVNSLYDG